MMLFALNIEFKCTKRVGRFIEIGLISGNSTCEFNFSWYFQRLFWLSRKLFWLEFTVVYSWKVYQDSPTRNPDSLAIPNYLGYFHFLYMEMCVKYETVKQFHFLSLINQTGFLYTTTSTTTAFIHDQYKNALFYSPSHTPLKRRYIFSNRIFLQEESNKIVGLNCGEKMLL